AQKGRLLAAGRQDDLLATTVGDAGARRGRTEATGGRGLGVLAKKDDPFGKAFDRPFAQAFVVPKWFFGAYPHNPQSFSLSANPSGNFLLKGWSVMPASSRSDSWMCSGRTRMPLSRLGFSVCGSSWTANCFSSVAPITRSPLMPRPKNRTEPIDQWSLPLPAL